MWREQILTPKRDSLKKEKKTKNENLTSVSPVSYTHLRAHETRSNLVCRLLLEKKNQSIDLVSEFKKEQPMFSVPFEATTLTLASRGGDSYMKQTGLLVVSLRGVNFGFWSRLGCSGQSANILSRQGLA